MKLVETTTANLQMKFPKSLSQLFCREVSPLVSIQTGADVHFIKHNRHDDDDDDDDDHKEIINQDRVTKPNQKMTAVKKRTAKLLK